MGRNCKNKAAALIPKSHLYTFLTIALLYLSGYLLIGRWQTMFYYGDTNGYYLHVVSFMLYGDVGSYDESIGSLQAYHPGADDPREDEFGVRLTEKGRRYIKYTLGTPLMEAPFFALAHAVAKLTPIYEANGWSPPYTFIVGLSTFCYLMLGFWLLLKVLLRYFPAYLSLLTILVLAAATNLFYHGTYMAMSHGFLFFDYCLLLFLTDGFYRQPKRWKALAIGATVGLITLTRVPEVISALIPILWGVSSWATFGSRMQFFFKKHLDLLALAAFGLLAVFSLQLGYWYYVSGQLVFNPYDGEGFNFLNPKIHKGWFDFENGWLVYTPVMALSLIGLFLLPRYTKGKVLPIALFVFLQAYIHYSYYVWNYFPGFGSRPMVETYAALSFGLAACMGVMLRRTWSKMLLGFLLLCFTTLNLFQTWQMKKGIIWSERGNIAFYMETFGKRSSSRQALIAFDTKERQPDSSRLVLIDTLWQEGFEQSPNRKQLSKAQVLNGEYALLTAPGNDTLLNLFALPTDIAGDYLRISVSAYMQAKDQIWDRGQAAMLGVALLDERGKRTKRHFFRPSSHIGNTDYNIWTAGKAEQWGKAAFFTRVPKRTRQLRLEIRNPYGHRLFLDEFVVEHYRSR
jgi:hypothetical protein